MNLTEDKWIGFTHGLTATGKTTLCEYLENSSEVLVPISNSKIKRDLVNEYSWMDSTNESLRDLSYQKSIASAIESVEAGRIPIIDASFHSLRRRYWLYKACMDKNIRVFCLHLVCSQETSRMRIQSRQMVSPNWKTQASNFEVYKHLLRTGEAINSNELERLNLYLKIDTLENCLLLTTYSHESAFVERLVESVVIYLESRENNRH